MDSSGRIDQALFSARADAIRAHPRFPIAKRRFCTEVPAMWLASPVRRRLIADTGAMAVSITVTGLNRLDPVNGASLETMIRGLEASHFASGNRARSLIDMLQRSGAVESVPHPHDGRRLKLAPTPLLQQTHRDWMLSVLGPLSEVATLAGPPEELAAESRLAERYITSIMLRQVVDGFTIFAGWPEAEAFMNRRHGYLLMLALADAVDLRADVNRVRTASWYGVSPAHIATMLADAEAHGWVKRLTPSSIVELDPGFADRLELWVARELAIVAMWLDIKRPVPARPQDAA
jgi:hypothetical protein